MPSTKKSCWFAGETPIRLYLLAALIPPTDAGKRVSVSSLYRWAQAGVHGVRLRTFRIGGRMMTTHEEFVRWSQALTDSAESGDS
jgi:hypothetical protein